MSDEVANKNVAEENKWTHKLTSASCAKFWKSQNYNTAYVVELQETY